MARANRRGRHDFIALTKRTMPSGIKIGERQSAGSCTCGALFIADRADDVRSTYDEHLAKIAATGQGVTLIAHDVRVTVHFSEHDEDAGFTDAVYVPLEEWEHMSAGDRDSYIAQMVGERIDAEKERRANQPPEPTHDEVIAQHERRSTELQAEWYRNEADRLDAAQRAQEAASSSSEG